MNISKLIIVITIFFNTQGYNAQTLVNHVKQCIQKANNHESKLDPSILSLEGLSSNKVRHFLNNICSLPNASYLEIGIFKGSTFISALYKNTDTLSDATGIDNWSEFGYQKNSFLNNATRYLPPNSFRLFEINCFTLDVKKIIQKPVTIYFYDGSHSQESQKQAFVHFNAIFDDCFIAIVDDWNIESVPKGTKQAFNELQYAIVFEELLAADGGIDTVNWWNGLYVAVIQKTK